jgi:hypothetical protein
MRKRGKHFLANGKLNKYINVDPKTGKPTGTIDYGKFMLNDHFHEAKAAALGMNIYTLEGNTAYAYHLYETEGTEPWIWTKPCWVKNKNMKSLIQYYIRKQMDFDKKEAITFGLASFLTALFGILSSREGASPYPIPGPVQKNQFASTKKIATSFASRITLTLNPTRLNIRRGKRIEWERRLLIS